MNSLRVFEWPEDIEDDIVDLVDGRGLDVELVLLDLHPLDVVGVVVPDELGCLLDAGQVLDH